MIQTHYINTQNCSVFAFDLLHDLPSRLGCANVSPLFVVYVDFCSMFCSFFVVCLYCDTREKSFLKKTWENSSKTLKCVFLRFNRCLSTNFTASVA
ncbi:hypothetical protein HMPREF3204_00463 [Gardnerella pickettii]|nr:hypothetical protein HMPREF3204_00463 [Gardnerella pickettii]